MEGFRINYTQVLNQADTIQNLSGNLEQEIQKLDRILTSVKSNWKGPASTEFQNHLVLLITDMKETKSSMLNISSTIRGVATEIQQEDERQAELARQLAEANK